MKLARIGAVMLVILMLYFIVYVRIYERRAIPS